MPSKLGEFCVRCATKCVKVRKGDKIEFHCPNRHGIQRIEDAPKEELPAESAAAEDGTGVDPHEGVDDVARQI